MSILLEHEINLGSPNMVKIKQKFNNTFLENVNETIKKELLKQEIASLVTPGAKVAIAVGSRGINRLEDIIKTTIGTLKSLGASPFIVSAMGSHGSGTEAGQREILEEYGITEKNMSVPVITSVDVVKVGELNNGLDVYTDKTAYENADLTILINRVKPHTDFEGEIESGLCKMAVIGLGNHIGCASIHKSGFENFSTIIEEAARIVFEKTKISFGIAIIENAADKVCHIEAIKKDSIIIRERELLKKARESMARLHMPEIDVLVVEEIGKNISGNGVDPNIVGRHGPMASNPNIPKVNYMVVLGLSKETHGNAIGIGLADITTREVFDNIDFKATYVNSIASRDAKSSKLPIVLEDEKEAIAAAIKLWGGEPLKCRIVRIKNSLELENIWVSENMLPYIKEKEELFELYY